MYVNPILISVLSTAFLRLFILEELNSRIHPMPSPAQLENVARVERLAFYPILEETVLMDPATPLECYKGIKADGTYPAATTEVVRGIIHYFSEDQADDVYCSAMSEGIAIVMIEPGETILIDWINGCPTSLH